MRTTQRRTSDCRTAPTFGNGAAEPAGGAGRRHGRPPVVALHRSAAVGAVPAVGATTKPGAAAETTVSPHAADAAEGGRPGSAGGAAAAGRVGAGGARPASRGGYSQVRQVTEGVQMRRRLLGRPNGQAAGRLRSGVVARGKAD